MDLHVTDPLTDHRWDDLVACHPKASIFHERAWLEALNRTYGYEPFVLTSAPAGKPLTDGVVLCRVSSWITGTRSVSLPFADHCDPLLGDIGEAAEFTNWLRAECDRRHWKYFELRPRSDLSQVGQLLTVASYCLHTLDTTPELGQIFRGFHRDSIQRRILRAEREHLSYKTGRSEQLIEQFYRLLVRTRRRHELVPQPRTWFRNLVACMGDRIEIRLALKNGTPIAAILTLRHRSSIVYKYGCSDERFHHLAGMPFLFWKLIEECKESGVEEIDFGRSDLDNQGLITFKDRFGTTRKALKYLRYSPPGARDLTTVGRSQTIRKFFSVLPDAALPVVGRMLYRHMG